MSAVRVELSALRRHWTRLAQIATWLVAVLATFLMAPPRRAPAVDDASWTRLAQFVLVIMLGLMIGTLARRRNVHAVCRRASAVLLLLGVAVFFINLRLGDQWPCDYDGRGPMVVGATLSTEALQFKQQNPGAGCSMLLQSFVGNTAQIWSANEIGTRYVTLISLYLANVLCFSLSMVLMLESLGTPAPHRRRTS